MILSDSIIPEKFIPTLQSFVQQTLDYLKENDSEFTQEGSTALGNQFDKQFKENFEKQFEKLVYGLLEERPPKISVLGYNDVGKTSICNYIQGKQPEQLTPTMTIERHSFRLFDIPVIVWDFSDEILEKTAKKFLLGSDAVIIVLDSTKNNAENSLRLLKLTKEIVPHAELILIGNKQDKDKALPIEKLEKIMGQRVIPFNATDFANARLIQKQTAELLEIVSEELNYTDESYVIQRND